MVLKVLSVLADLADLALGGRQAGGLGGVEGAGGTDSCYALEVQAGENEANSPLWRSRAAHLALEGVSACFGYHD